MLMALTPTNACSYRDVSLKSCVSIAGLQALINLSHGEVQRKSLLRGMFSKETRGSRKPQKKEMQLSCRLSMFEVWVAARIHKMHRTTI